MHVLQHGLMQLHHDPAELADVFEALLDSDNTSYVLSSDLELVRVNAGWERFARANGGERVLLEWYPGRRILEGISDVLRPFYALGYLRALRDGLRWEHDYECSSAIEFRTFRMIVLPSRNTLVVTHSPLVVIPNAHAISEPSAEYISYGRIIMCAHCRRVRNAHHPKRWDWVPAFVADMPPNVSHGLCPPCARYYAQW